MNRWTEDYKTIMNSRIESTNRLFKFFEAQTMHQKYYLTRAQLVIIHLQSCIL